MIICCFSIIIPNLDFFFTCRFIMVLFLFNSRKHRLWDLFIYMFFLFLFYFPNIIIPEIGVFSHGILHHAFAVTSHMSIVVAFKSFYMIPEWWCNWIFSLCSCELGSRTLIVIPVISSEIHNNVPKVSTWIKISKKYDRVLGVVLLICKLHILLRVVGFDSFDSLLRVCGIHFEWNPWWHCKTFMLYFFSCYHGYWALLKMKGL